MGSGGLELEGVEFRARMPGFYRSPGQRVVQLHFLDLLEREVLASILEL